MTTKLYDLDSHCRVFSGQVLSCSPAEGGKWHITLDQTAFFPEGGGQPADQGTLGGRPCAGRPGKGDAIVHITDGPLSPGETVTGELDWPPPVPPDAVPLRGARDLGAGPQPLRLHQRGLPHGGERGHPGL